MIKLGMAASALVLVVGVSAAGAQDYPMTSNGQLAPATNGDTGPGANTQWPPYGQRNQYYRPGGALYGYGYDNDAPAANKQWSPPPASAMNDSADGYAWNDVPRPNQQWPAPRPNMPQTGYGYGADNGPAANQQYPAPAPNAPDE